MSNNETLFEADGLQVTGDPADGPRGPRLVLTTAGGQPARLLEGEARRLHLTIRAWIRHNKALRGDTPRGRKKADERRQAYKAAASAPLGAKS